MQFVRKCGVVGMVYVGNCSSKRRVSSSYCYDVTITVSRVKVQVRVIVTFMVSLVLVIGWRGTRDVAWWTWMSGTRRVGFWLNYHKIIYYVQDAI